MATAAKSPMSRISKDDVAGLFEGRIGYARDERDQVQKKTFTKWINKHLAKINRHVDNLYEDLRDGHNLIALLEVLSGITLPREKGRMRFHKLQNVEIALDFLKQKKLRLVNIRNDDITDGNPKLTLGLIWTIILHFQIEDISVEGWEDLSAKQALLMWAQRNMEGYENINVTNFTTSWRDGKALNAILHRNRPEVLDIDFVHKNDNKTNLEQAFSIAEHEFGVTRLLDCEDIDVDNPDERSIITYISSLYDRFPVVPEFPITVNEEQWLFVWEEYRLLTTSLMEWIEKQIIVMRKRDDIDAVETPTEAQALIDELKRFEKDDLPPKEGDVESLIPKYKSIEELSLESRGKYQPCEGSEPHQVLSLWKGLITAIDDRDAALITLYNKLKMMHELCMKITLHTKNSHQRLDEVDKLLQEIVECPPDYKELESKSMVLLNNCENQIKEAFADVQTVKDNNYYQAEEMYRMVFALHERWVNARSEFNIAQQTAEKKYQEQLERERTKLEETSEYILLENCLAAVESLKTSILHHPWGNDQLGVENQLNDFAEIDKKFIQLEDAAEECEKNKNNFETGSDDHKKFSSLLSQLHQKLDETKNVKVERLYQLQDLFRFIKEATLHLIFLNEKEDNIMEQKISETGAALLEKHYMNLMGDIEAQEPAFIATVKKGESLLEIKHPASSVVKSYLDTMKDQWKFLLDLTLCLENHIADTSKYQQFSCKCDENENWLDLCEQKVKEMQSVSHDDFTMCEAELKDKEAFCHDIKAHGATIADTVEQSNHIPCIAERNITNSCENPSCVKALCSYRANKIAIAKGEDCRVTSKVDEKLVDVITSSDQQGSVPNFIFQYQPPSAEAVKRAAVIQERYNKLLVDVNECIKKFEILFSLHKINEKFQTILAMDVDEYRNLTPSERELLVVNITEDMRLIDVKSKELEDMNDQVETCHMNFNLCEKHVDALRQQLNDENDAQQQCQTYCSRLNVLLRRLSDLHETVIIRIQKSSLTNNDEVPELLADHQGSVDELERCEPHYKQVCSEAKSVADKFSAFPCSQTLRSQLDVVNTQWNISWNVTHVYLDKVKVVLLLIDDIQDTESVLQNAEERLADKYDERDISKLKEQQKKYQSIYEIFLLKDPIVVTLNKNCEKLQQLSEKLVNDESSEKQQTIDVQFPILAQGISSYTETVKNISERWQTCKVCLAERLERITEVLPQVQKAADDEEKTLEFIKKLESLLQQMKALESSQGIAKIQNMHKLTSDDLQTLLNAQEDTVNQSENIKQDYDTTQGQVVNFINTEVTSETENLTKLRNILHEVQSVWAVTWLVVHVHLEKIKGFLHVFRAKKQCDLTIVEYETAIDSCVNVGCDIAEMKHSHQHIKTLVEQIPKHDANFEVVTQNFKATEDVVKQLPDTWKSDHDTNSIWEQIEKMLQHWDDIKHRLNKLCEDLKNSITEEEKAQASKHEIDKLREKVAAFNAELNVLVETQNSKILMPLSHDRSSLEKCLAQQQTVADNLHLLSGKYFNLGAECSECKSNMKDSESEVVYNALEKLDVEEELMHQLWQDLSERAELFKSKLLNLLSAVEKLQMFDHGTSKYEDVLENYPKLKDIEKLKQHKDSLLELTSSVDQVDETDGIARISVDELTKTASELLKNSPTATDAEDVENDMDASKCNDDFLSIHERWLKVKLQLCKQLELCGEAIEKEEQGLEYETLLNTLLLEIKQLTDELKKVESSQVVRAEMMLPNDSVALQNIYNQQKERKLLLETSTASRYSDLLRRCDQALERQIAIPSVEILIQNFDQLKNIWELVLKLVQVYFVKLEHIKTLAEAISHAEPILKKYKTKVAEVKGSVEHNADDILDPDHIEEACERLEEIQKHARTDEPTITDVAEAVMVCQEVLDDAPNDQDFAYYQPACQKLQEDWASLFDDLLQLLTTLRNALPEAKRISTINTQATDILAKLEKLQAELEGMTYTIQAWMALTLPVELDPIKKAKSQHEIAQKNFVEILKQFDILSTEAAPLLSTSTPITHKLQNTIDKVKQQISEVENLNDYYAKKLELLYIATEAVNTSRVPLCHCEKELLLYDTMADNPKELEQQIKIFEELAADIPKHDPKFIDLEEKCRLYQETATRLSTGDESSGQMYINISKNFNKRWETVKNQITERLTYLYPAHNKLSEIKTKTKEFSEWLNDKEPMISKPKENLSDSQLIKTKIDEHEEIQSELVDQSGHLNEIQGLVTEFDTAASKYDEFASTYDPPLPEGMDGSRQISVADMEERSRNRKTVIEYEIITVTRKYDKLKNLLSEKIDHYKVDFKNAKDHEEALKNSTVTTTTTEITTTTTKRNYRDIKFNSFLKRKASLHDLHLAGLVSDELAQQLEMGVVQEEEVQSKLQPYLTGSKPIAGLIVQKANNMKVSINTAIKHGLIKTGTGLVLLEAQAATGSMINPLTGELMSVEEAYDCGLIDSKYLDALQRAEKAVTGFEDPVTHQYLSLYECMKKGYIVESHGIRLLEAQIATGGLIDPRANHRVPISVAYKRGLFDERMNQILEDPSDDTKGFFDPNTQKNLTYLELMSRCQIDPDSELLFLVLTKPNINVESLLRGNKKRSRMDIRFTTAYYHEARLQDIYDAGLVTEEQVKGLEEGKLTESDLESQLKVYLFGGEEPIAGVMIEETGELLSIAEAARKGIIKRGTAIELLEAQAATGNIVDPKTGNKMSVEQAFSIGLIDRVHVDTLERAQRAVRGYPAPGTKEILSLFEAMRKGLVVESRGIRLLEAQIATGGLIDPRAHHRVPISVAYKRGLFDERMNQILEDPSDDTKGFFDPNTQENLSYLDLMDRCEVKGEHNLRFLILQSNRKSKRTKAVEKAMKSKQKKTIRFKTAYNTEVTLEDLKWLQLITDATIVQANSGALSQAQLENDLKSNLHGTPPVCGVMVVKTKERLSFLEACNRNYLEPEIALKLLEAQACTGGIINTKTMENLSVQDAYMSGIIDRHQHSALSLPESFVCGFFENGTRKSFTFRQMIKKKLLKVDNVVKLLHCQLATGGIIEPSTKVRVSQETALKLGIIDDEINDLLKKEDQFFINPGTHQCTSYQNLLTHCENTLPFFPLNIRVNEGIVSNSKNSRKDTYFETTLKRSVSLISLLEIGLVSESSVTAYEEGLLSKEELFQSIRQYLVGEHAIAGIIIEATGQKLSILECIQKGIIKRGTGLELLEAQAAIGCIINPVSGERHGVSEALSIGLIDNTQKDALERAQRAVLGYKDPVTGKILSLFEAMNKGYVTESRGIRLLEAQIATGGLIDPTVSTRVPLSIAHKRGIINDKMFKILTDPSDDTKGFFDPNTEENLTYLELMSRCSVEPSSGMVYLTLSEKKKSRRSRKSEEPKRKKKTTHRSRKVVIIDPDTGKELSIREAYKKGFIDKASAYQLMEQEGEWKEEVQLEQPSEPLLSPVKENKLENQATNSSQMGMVSADDLSARLSLLAGGQFQPIGGIVDVKKEECITIAEAEKRRLIDSTSAQRLYEAQAATGGILDPNKPDVRLSVNQALASGVIDRRVAQRIGNGEKAFAGFPDKRSNSVLSLGQAIKKGICYYESGTRLLEYQSVTGGIVDPADGSRLSLEEAMHRGWIDQRMFDRLSDLSRYTKSVVDLKTNLLISYADALEKSVVDPATGIRLMEALPRLERNVKLGGVTIQASSGFTSLSSSLASSRAESPVGSRRTSRRGSVEH